MLKRRVEIFVLISSLILHSKTLLVCGKLTKSPNLKDTFSRVGKQFSTTFKHTTFRRNQFTVKVEKEARKQGIFPLLRNIDMAELSEEPIIKLPPGIKGMKKLDKTAFETTMKVPCVIVQSADLHRVVYLMKQFLFKMLKFNSVKDFDEVSFVEKSDNLEPKTSLNKSDSKQYQTDGHAISSNSSSKVILLNPAIIKNFEDFGEDNIKALEAANLTAENFAHTEVKLDYNNFSADEILKAILPTMISSFTSVGHICHCNLREEHEEYKFLIGEVLLDKVSKCETVVSKTHNINSTYRNFQMELLAGKPDMVTIHRENGCAFQMDFSKVYWNSRLSTEHARLCNEINKGDLLLDVFAGIGPFSIPAAWKGARVIANDLNPDSVTWLQKSIQLNKRNMPIQITVVNKDAKDFIETDVRAHLLQWIETKTKEFQVGKINPNEVDKAPRVKIAMNLPASAIEFVKYLRVLTEDEFDSLEGLGPLPMLYLYVFCPKMDLETKALIDKIASTAQLFESHGLRFDSSCEVFFVRNVAPNKNMYKVKVPLGREYLQRRGVELKRGEKREGDKSEGEVKKARVE